METEMQAQSGTAPQRRMEDEQSWYELYEWLLPCVRRWVRYADVACWYGQQWEISEDIAQEAVMRTFHYSQRAGRGEVRSISSLKALSKTIAQNYFRDRRKKDCCLVHPQANDFFWGAGRYDAPHVDPSQVAVDHLILTSTITNAAHALLAFPPRQRNALLTDLANIADFGDQPSPLEQALSDEGVQLRDYHQPLPQAAVERNRHAALLCIAYKRLRREVAAV